ncbi:DUF3549 family protein [Paraferrimonas sedimenticola]|nr:DUF3549 family protein [Paraferrimonas sedimenticola]
MEQINTLGDFLQASGSQYQVFDLGRRIVPIDHVAFQQIEALSSPYPYPLQGHAFLGIVFWKSADSHFVWFLKLPLDERGLIQPAARTQFMQQVLEGLGQDPTQPLSQEQQQELASNILVFTPSQNKLATFNAKVKQTLGQSASAQYELAYQYLSGQMPSEHWQQLGLQGIADFVARLDELDHAEVLLRALAKLPEPVLQPVLSCLENQKLNDDLAGAIAAHVMDSLNNDVAPERLHSWLRGLAGHPGKAQMVCEALLAHPKLDVNSLAIIAARHWPQFERPEFALQYLEAAALQEFEVFAQLFADLVAIPSVRVNLLAQLRNPERSEALGSAIGQLFKGTIG